MDGTAAHFPAHGPGSDGEVMLVRIQMERIYEDSGLTRQCYYGLDDTELQAIRQKEHGGGAADVYGDTDVDLVRYLFREARHGQDVTTEDVFLDLGSGSGKLTLSFLLLTPAVGSVGVELSHTRHCQAMAAKVKADEMQLFKQQDRLPELHCGSMLDADCSRASLIFCYNLCFDEEFLLEMSVKMIETLPLGATVLLRGQRLPSSSTRTAGVRTSRVWGVCCRPSNEVVASPVLHFKCLQQVMETRIQNRLYQYFGYTLTEIPILHTVSDIIAGRGCEEDVPNGCLNGCIELDVVCLDDCSKLLVQQNPSMRSRLLALAKGAQATLEQAEAETRTEVLVLDLVQVKEQLDDSGFERSVFAPPPEEDPDELIPLWELLDMDTKL